MPTIHPCGPSPLRSKAFRFDRRTRCAAAGATFIATRSCTRPRASSGRARSHMRTRSSATRTSAACRRCTKCEIDLDLLLAAESAGGFGAIRATRKPLPMCRAEVSSCYTRRENELGPARTRVLRSRRSARPPSACSRRFSTPRRAAAASASASSGRGGRATPRRPRRRRRVPSGPGVSSTAGSSCSAGCARKRPSRSPMRPSRTLSCRSRFEPSGAFESLMCSARRRSRPILVVDLGEQAVEGIGIGDVVARRVQAGTSRDRGRGADGAPAARRSLRARRPSGRSCPRRRRCSRSGATSCRRTRRAQARARLRHGRASRRTPVPRWEPTWKATPSASIARRRLRRLEKRLRALLVEVLLRSPPRLIR